MKESKAGTKEKSTACNVDIYINKEQIERREKRNSVRKHRVTERQRRKAERELEREKEKEGEIRRKRERALTERE